MITVLYAFSPLKTFINAIWASGATPESVFSPSGAVPPLPAAMPATWLP